LRVVVIGNNLVTFPQPTPAIFFHCSWYKLCQLIHFTDEESVELGASPTILNPKRMYVSCTVQMPAATNLQTEKKSKPQFLAIYAHIAG
jgi:hypothetical protein